MRLEDFSPQTDFFVGIDSDGCVFDSMEIKHKECFCPAFINWFDLQPVSKYAREVWEYVNLYGKSRGVNRFKAVLQSLELLAERPEVKDRNLQMPQLPELRAWVERESKLGNPALEAEVERTGNEELKHVLGWSHAVNDAVQAIVRNVPPFPWVRETLDHLSGTADTIVVSQTPSDALHREWAEHNIADRVALIAGQELGTKSEHLQATAGPNYAENRVLMIGDAPGDRRAAESVGALFYPIIPGREEESWRRLYEESLERFFSGSYHGSYQEELLRDFEAALPDRPPWQKGA
jgi:phosphoglycolate phosphatase-like HAD superfamily hydrolase